MRLKYLAFLITAFLFSELPTLSAARGIHALQLQRAYPALIGRETNNIVELKVTAEEEGHAIKSLQFDFKGTDELHDIGSMTLFLGGPEGQLTTEWSVGTANTPADRLIFSRRITLKKGDNWFWLSCKLKSTASLLHHIDVECSQIETTAGLIKPLDKMPGRKIRIGYALCQQGQGGTHTYRIPAVTRAKDGSLLAFYDMRHNRTKDLQEDIDIGLSKSTDGGQTWSEPRPIMDRGEWGGLPQDQNGISDPGVIVDPKTGKIFVWAVWMYGKPGKHQWNGDGSEAGYEIGKTAQMLLAVSKDHGETWSELQNVTRDLKKEEWVLFAPAPQNGITLSKDGTLVMPVQGRNAAGAPFSTIMSSKNHGRSWKVGNPTGEISSECQAVELLDGSVMLNMRSSRDKAHMHRAVMVTKDLGKTWTPHPTHHKELIEPVCNGSTIRITYIQDGQEATALLFANPNSQQRRERHTIKVSFDDGMTWPESHHHLLDEFTGFGYPSLVQIDEEHVGIVFEGSRSHIMFMKFTIAELVAGNSR